MRALVSSKDQEFSLVQVILSPISNLAGAHGHPGRFSNPFPLTSAAYDVSADGQRFLMVKENSNRESSTAQINIVQNWFEELKRRVPPGTK